MTTTPADFTAPVAAPVALGKGRVPASARFDLIMTLLYFWPIVGGYSDSWAHNNIAGLDTFFTPWHAFFYSGIFAVMVFMFGYTLWNRLHGYAWRSSLPPGYGLALGGVILIAVAGVGDGFWHTIFGIERDVAAIFSPTHVGVLLGMGLLMAAPLRAVWLRPASRSARGWQLVPAVVAATFLVALFILPMQFSHPFVYPWAAAGQLVFSATPAPDPYYTQTLGVLSMVVQVIFLMSVVLVLARRWTLFPGALTLIIALPIAMISTMRQTYFLVPAAVVAGLLADVTYWALRPTAAHPLTMRVFAATTPALLAFAYFGDLALTTGIQWPIHLWIGTAFTCGLAGWFLSFVAVPGAASANGQ